MERATPAWRIVGPIGLALVVIGAAAKLPEAVLPIGSDFGMFATYGRLMLEGQRPYVDLWDVHSPLVFYYWAAIERLAGSEWIPGCLARWGPLAAYPCADLLANSVDLLLGVASAMLVYAIGRALGGGVAEAVLAAVLTVFYVNVSMISMEGSNPTKLTLLPSTLAAWAYLKAHRAAPLRWGACCGGAAALAVLAKQPGLLLPLALAAHAWWDAATGELSGRVSGRFWKGFASTSALLLLGVVLYLWRIGSLGAFAQDAWIYNLERLVQGYWHSPHGLIAPSFRLDRVLRDSAGLLFLAAAIGAMAVVFRRRRPVQTVLLVWAAANCVALAGFREFALAVPCFALLAAFGIHRLWDAAGRDGLGLGPPAAGRAAVFGLFGTVFVLTTGFQVTEVRRAVYERGPNAPPANSELLAAYLRTEVPAGDLFVWGDGGHMYALSGRQPASRFLNSEALKSVSPHAEASRALLVQELEARQPVAIVTAPHSDQPSLQVDEFPAFRRILASGYVCVTRFTDPGVGWGLYVRRDAAQEAPPSGELGAATLLCSSLHQE